MTIAWPPVLVDAIARRRSVIVIGSGVSANARTETGDAPPVWSAFLRTAYVRLGRRVKHIQAAITHYDYLAACEYLKNEHGPNWSTVLRQAFAEPRYRPAEIHETIFNLDSRVVASLNFDKIYESYAISASDGTVVVKNYYDDDIRQVLAGGGRYILKPHGDIDTIPKLIFTTSDYASARVAHARFYEMLSALLHTHTFLMIGCGLSDPDLQFMFEDYKNRMSEDAHFMTYASKLNPAEAALIQRTRGMQILPYSSKSDHAEVKVGLKGLLDLVNAKRDELARNQNW